LTTGLELAKIIYTRMIKEAKNEMNEKKLSKTLLTLGEENIENDNWEKLDMESKIIGKTHYHLWVALSYESGKLMTNNYCPRSTPRNSSLRPTTTSGSPSTTTPSLTRM